jgi:hypothetical protein
MKRHFTRVCIVDTVYTLLVYLLYSSEDELEKTFYFFGDGIHESIRKRFNNHYYFDISKKFNRNKLWLILSLRIGGYFRWPFLKRAKIMGHDHLVYSPYIIGKRNYTYIEDGPNIFKFFQATKFYKDICLYWTSKRLYFIKRLFNFIISNVFAHPIANNNQCKELILTVDDDVPYIAKKKKYIVSLDEMWQNATKQKKQYILHIYDISTKDIDVLRIKPYIIFTQQFSTDKFISELEQIDIYRKILGEYNTDHVVLKPHPRDRIDYKKYFSDVYIFEKIVPIQLLNLIGVRFKKAIAVNSSAVLSFPYEIEREWIGTTIHPVLYKLFGNPSLEEFIGKM